MKFLEAHWVIFLGIVIVFFYVAIEKNSFGMGITGDTTS